MVGYDIFQSSREEGERGVWSIVDSCYYDTAGIREMYQYIQTIDITSINFHYLV
jgi:hypothetical protein